MASKTKRGYLEGPEEVFSTDVALEIDAYPTSVGDIASSPDGAFIRSPTSGDIASSFSSVGASCLYYGATANLGRKSISSNTLHSQQPAMTSPKAPSSSTTDKPAATRIGEEEEEEDLGDLQRLCRCGSKGGMALNLLCRTCRVQATRFRDSFRAAWSRRFSDVDDWRPPQVKPRPSAASRARRASAEDLRKQYLKNELRSEELDGAVLRREDFMMKLAVALQSYGCPISRMEFILAHLLELMELDGSFSVLPNMIFVSFGSPASASSETHIIRMGQGLDVYKLRKVNHLCNQLLEKRINTLHDAIAKLDRIISEAELYNWQLKLICYAISSGTVAPLFFHGSLLDGLIAGLLGLIVGTLWVLSDYSYIMGKLMVIISSVVTSFIGTLFAANIRGACPLAIHYGPITYLLPGWSITMSVIELSTQHMISGTTRMFSALMSALLIGFGIDLGNRLAFWEHHNWASTDGCRPVEWWVLPPLFVVTLMCWNVLMKAAPAQWLGMTVVAGIGFTLMTFSSEVMTASSSSVLTAFVIGLFGNFYGYLTNSPAIIPILSGIFLIVPGGMSVKGVRMLLVNDFSGGLMFGFTVLVIAVSIAVGLFAASILAYKPKLVTWSL